MSNSGERDMVVCGGFLVGWFGLVGFFGLSLFLCFPVWLVGFYEKDGSGCAELLVYYSSCWLNRKGRGDIQLVYVEFNLCWGTRNT